MRLMNETSNNNINKNTDQFDSLYSTFTSKYSNDLMDTLRSRFLI